MLGNYSIGTASGLIVATGSVNALIWAARWADADFNAIIERLRINAVVTGTITTAVPYDLEVYRATGFTTPPSTGAVVATLSGNGRQSIYAAPKMSGIYTLTTLAAGMSDQVYTLDPHPLARLSGASGTVIGTQFFGGVVSLLDESITRSPVILGENEGIAIRAPLAGPATGTFRVAVNLGLERGIGMTQKSQTVRTKLEEIMRMVPDKVEVATALRYGGPGELISKLETIRAELGAVIDDLKEG
jgi:hypothetical protein